METQKQENGAVVKPELARHRSLSFGWMAIVIAITIVVITLAVNQLFNAGFFVGYTWLDNEYQYALFGLLVPIVFLIFPASGKSAMDKVPWYDVLFAVTTFGLLVFFFMNAEQILDNGWEMGAPDHIVALGFILWLLVLEATRRAGGTALFTIVLIISLYPLYADIMPGPISGLGSSLSDTTAYHVLSAESMLGIPMQALANLVIGFLIFGVALTQTGICCTWSCPWRTCESCYLLFRLDGFHERKCDFQRYHDRRNDDSRNAKNGFQGFIRCWC